MTHDLSHNLRTRTAIGAAFLVIVVGLTVASIYLAGKGQWDLISLYAGALANQVGLNPYDNGDLSRAMHGEVILRYVQPPWTLYIYTPLTLFPYHVAALIFLTAKLAALGCLIVIWRRMFDFRDSPILFMVLVPLAYNATVLMDLRLGNVSIFEELLIWIGFYCYFHERIGWFTVAILLAGMLKLTPLFFLGLLFVRRRKKEMICAVLAGLVFCMALGANALFSPRLFAGFLHAAAELTGEKAQLNPTTLALVRAVFHRLGSWAKMDVPGLIPDAICAVICVGAFVGAALVFNRLRLSENRQTKLWRICLICFLYGVVVPRFKNYSYILLIAPSLYVLLTRFPPAAVIPMSALLVINTYGGQYNAAGNALDSFFRLQGEYYVLLLAWAIGGYFCVSLLRSSAETATPDEVQPSTA